MKFYSFKNFTKALLFLFSILVIVLITTGISYWAIDKVQKKNNLMDIEEYSPVTSLVVEKNKINRSKYPFIDVHSHQWDMSFSNLEKLVSEMDSLNMGFMINLSGSGLATFTGNQSLMDLNLEKSLTNIKNSFPDRFGVFVNLDFNKIDNKDFAKNSVKIIEDAVSDGAIGLKVYKNLGLSLKDSSGKRVKVDDSRLSPIWDICGKLNIPVLIHSGEPSPFFDPIDKYNERWLHARQKPGSFRPSDKYPTFKTVMDEQFNMFKNHPNTTFINAHMGWMANDLNKLEDHLDNLPNAVSYTHLTLPTKRIV